MDLSAIDIVIIVAVASLVPLGFAAWRLFDAAVRGAPPEWRNVPRPRRRAIRKAILHGEAVDGTPAELWMVDGLVTALMRRANPARLVLPLLLAAFSAVYWLVLAVRRDDPAWLVLAAVYVALGVIQAFEWRRLKRRLDRAYVATYTAMDTATPGA